MHSLPCSSRRWTHDYTGHPKSASSKEKPFPGAATHIWTEKWLLCWCGQLKKDRSVPGSLERKKKKKRKYEKGKTTERRDTLIDRLYPVAIPQVFPMTYVLSPLWLSAHTAPSTSLKPGNSCSGFSYQFKHPFPNTLMVVLPSICTSNQGTYDTGLLSLTFTPPYPLLKIEAIDAPPLNAQHIVGASNSFLQTRFLWSHCTRDPLRFE